MTTSSSENAKSLNQAQFGANAANYASSPVHAKGASLDRMVELAAPQASWRGLDIATAAGHTAFAFAPHVLEMTATDLTRPGLLADLLDADDDIGAFLQPSGTTEANAVFVLTEGLFLAVKP